jgi:tetratricopeptide (TPR) repeat protein
LSPSTRSIVTGAHLVCICLLGLLCYANTAGNGFVFDDSAYLVSPLVRNLAVLDILGTNWLGLDIYRPLTLLSLALDFRLFAEEPFGYHLTNLLLHLANGTLFYVLARRLLNHASAALWAAMLYVAHPIQTEVVAWVSTRGDLLGTLFFLAGFLVHRHAEELGPENRSRMPWRPLAWTFCASAVLAKETAIVLPAVLLWHALCLDKSRSHFASFALTWLKRHWGYGVAIAVVLILRWQVLANEAALAGPASTNFLAELGFLQRLSTVVAILPRYLLLLILPRHLSADYSHASIPPVSTVFDPWLAIGLAAVAALVLIPKIWASRFLAFSTGSFWLCLLPVSNLLFLAPSGMAERYLHLAMIPVSLAAGWGGRRWLSEKPCKSPIAWIVVLSALAALSITTIERNRDWRSNYTLFSAVLQHYPRNARAHDNLAFVFYQREEYPLAIHHYRQAVLIQPTRVRTHFNLGFLYSQLRRYDEAIESFKTALSFNPNHIETHFNLGLAYQKTRRYQEAIGHYRTTLHLDRRHFKASYNLGRVYEEVERLDAAVQQYQALLRLDANFTKAHHRLGEVFRRQGRYQEMSAAWTTVLRLDPDHREAERIRRFVRKTSP